jgi:hypothetical protein
MDRHLGGSSQSTVRDGCTGDHPLLSTLSRMVYSDDDFLLQAVKSQISSSEDFLLDCIWIDQQHGRVLYILPNVVEQYIGRMTKCHTP